MPSVLECHPGRAKPFPRHDAERRHAVGSHSTAPLSCSLQLLLKLSLLSVWYTGQACTEIAYISCYQKPQVFFTQPLYKCSGDRTNTIRDVNAQNVHACHYKTKIEIKFENDDRFWSVSDTCSEINSGIPVNLYIQDIVYIDDLNVVISIRRSPVEELMWLVGQDTSVWPADRPMKSRTLHYFINMETMQIRAHAQWTHSTSDISNGQYSILC